MADPTWFTDAKFGLFVHFGLYSLPAGVWQGQAMGRNLYAEWIRWQHGWPQQPGLSQAEYDTLIERFDPQRFDADFICCEAAAAGMRYFVLTTKHHDGFALWPSKVSDYGIVRTASGRDLVGEMTAAGRRHGLKVGFYYSHWLDWEYPGGGLPPWPEIPADPPLRQPSDEAYERYWTGKVLPQVAELIDGYQPDLFWFDSWGQHVLPQLSTDRLGRLIALIRERSPQTLINSRIGTEAGVDYLSMGDNEFPNRRIRRPWETSATMNHSWGYSSLDKTFRPVADILRGLIDNVSRGGNLQLNIGPTGDGGIEPAVLRRLRDLASWMSVNGHALHGSRPVEAAEPPWGRLLQKGGTVYAFVYDWPSDGKLALPTLARPVVSGQVVETGAAIAVATTPAGQALVLPHRVPDDRVAVLALDHALKHRLSNGLRTHFLAIKNESLNGSSRELVRHASRPIICYIGSKYGTPMAARETTRRRGEKGENQHQAGA